MSDEEVDCQIEKQDEFFAEIEYWGIKIALEHLEEMGRTIQIYIGDKGE